MKNKIQIIFLALILSMSHLIVLDAETLAISSNLDFDDIEYTIVNDEVEITGYTGIVEDDTFILPNEIEGLPVTRIGNSAFLKKGIKGTVVLPDNIKIVGDYAFRENEIESVMLYGVEEIGIDSFNRNKVSQLFAPKLKTIDTGAFWNEQITKLELPLVESIGKGAFTSNQISQISMPNVKVVHEEAFSDNQIEKLNLPSVLNIGSHAFEKNKLKDLNLPYVKEVGIASFEHNDIQDIFMPELEVIGDYAFNDNSLKNLYLESVLEIGSHAFTNNQIENVELPNANIIGEGSFRDNLIREVYGPSLKIIGEDAFYNNLIVSLNAPKLEVLGDNAFDYNSLKSAQFESLPQLGERVFGDQKDIRFLNLFPIYIKNSNLKNEINLESNIVINPSSNKDFILEISKKYLLNDNQSILNYVPEELSKNNIVMAVDHQGHQLYCVSGGMEFTPGIYDIYEGFETVYLIEMGSTEVGIDQKVSFDKEPEDYLYSYDNQFLSKFIWHASNMFSNLRNEELKNVNNPYALIHLIASNYDIDTGVHIDEANFEEILETTLNQEAKEEGNKTISIYQELLNGLGEEFMGELFSRIKKDQREYTLGSYFAYADHELNIVELSQPVFRPGEPIEEFVEISIEKKWMDSKGNSLNNKEIPDSIKINLYQNGVVLNEYSISKESDWNLVIKNLEKYDEMGILYKYSIVEQDLEGFTSEMEILADNNWILKNVQDEEDDNPPSPEEPKNPKPEEPKNSGVEGKEEGRYDNEILPSTGHSALTNLLFFGLLSLIFGLYLTLKGKRNIHKKFTL